MSTIPPASHDAGVTEPRWLDADEARAWRGYLLMTRLLFAELSRGLSREAGMSPADYEVLVQLTEAPDHRLRMYELASQLVWEKSRLSHQITRMQQRGLVDRQGCASDARGAFVVLTQEGLDAITGAAPSHVTDVRKHFFDQLTTEQVKALAEMAESVVDHLTGSGGTPLSDEGSDCG